MWKPDEKDQIYLSTENDQIFMRWYIEHMSNHIWVDGCRGKRNTQQLLKEHMMHHTCMNESIVHSDSRVHQDQCVHSTELLYIYFTIAKMDTPSTDCHF